MLRNQPAEALEPGLRAYELARKGGFGAAVLEYDIGDDGGVENAEIVYSIPDEAYNETALEAVKEWRVISDLPPPECRNGLLVDLTYIMGDVQARRIGSRILLRLDE